jgi:hypothetical protein
VKIKELSDKMQAANRELGQKQRDGELDADGAAAARKKNQDILNDELGKILTDDQKAKIKAMGGAPFELKEGTK